MIGSWFKPRCNIDPVTRRWIDDKLVWLTDLTVVHLGRGLFLANSPRHWASDTGVWPGTDLVMPRYMTAPMYGYALASRAVGLGDSRASWRRCLNLGVRAEFKAAMRFLQSQNAAGSTGVRVRAGEINSHA